VSERFGSLPGGGSHSGDPANARPGYYGGRELASLRDRYISAAIDYGWLILVITRVLELGFIATLFLLWLNVGLLQGLTGKSIGKSVMRITLGQAVMNTQSEMIAVYPGVGTATRRMISHWRDVFTLGTTMAMSVDRQSAADKEWSMLVFTNDMRLLPKPKNAATILPR
jgi:hypothetical protein